MLLLDTANICIIYAKLNHDRLYPQEKKQLFQIKASLLKNK